MLAVGALVALAGYTLVAYGWSQVRGCNAGLFDVVWPGRFHGCNPDTGGAGGPTAVGQDAGVSNQNVNVRRPVAGKCPKGWHLENVPRGKPVCVRDGTTYHPHPGR